MLSIGRFHKRVLFVLIFTILSFLLVITAKASDPYEQVWNMHISGIRTLEATFSRLRGDRLGKPPQQQWIKIDMNTSWFKGKVLKTRIDPKGNDQIIEDGYGKYEGTDWRSTRMDPDEGRRIDLLPEGKGIPKEVKLAEIGYDWLKWAFLPYHIYILQNIPDAKIDLVSQTESKQIGNGQHLIYSVNVRDGLVVEIAYDVCLSDGVQIHRTEVRANGQLAYLIENRGFGKHNGIWFPKHSEYKDYFGVPEETSDKERKPRNWSVIDIEQISFNKDYDVDDFRPEMAPGDYVVNQIVGIKYRYKGSDDNIGTEHLEKIANLPMGLAKDDSVIVPLSPNWQTRNTPVTDKSSAKLSISENTKQSKGKTVTESPREIGEDASHLAIGAKRYWWLLIIVIIGFSLVFLITRRSRTKS